jgi:hypothetical protein
VARVVLAPGLRRFADGHESLEVAANDVRGLLAALYRKYPELEARLARGIAIAIDGEVIPGDEAYLLPLRTESEVHFLPQIGGG